MKTCKLYLTCSMDSDDNDVLHFSNILTWFDKHSHLCWNHLKKAQLLCKFQVDNTPVLSQPFLCFLTKYFVLVSLIFFLVALLGFRPSGKSPNFYMSFLFSVFNSARFFFTLDSISLVDPYWLAQRIHSLQNPSV